MRLVTSIVIATAAACVALPAVAQDVGSGFWASAVLGTGRQRSTCDICAGQGNGGWALRLAAGGTLNPKIRLGGEFLGWTDKTEDISSRFLLLAPTVSWRPSSKIPYFLTGGVGFASFETADSTEALTSSSLGVTVGVGYELPVAQRWALTGYLGLSGSLFADLVLDRTNIASVRHTLLHIGIGVVRR